MTVVASPVTSVVRAAASAPRPHSGGHTTLELALAATTSLQDHYSLQRAIALTVLASHPCEVW